MEIIEDNQNQILNRREVKIIFEKEKNPSYEEAREILFNQFKSDKERIAVKKVQGRFGRNTFLISGFIYDSIDGLNEFEKIAGDKPQEAPQQSQTAKTEEKTNK